MRGALERTRRVPDAWRAAVAAASRAQVEVRDLETMSEHARASRLFDAVWQSSDETLMPAGLLRAMRHAGNYAAGAFRSGELIGAIAGFWGFERGHPHLHSHILAVLPGSRGRHVGFALKEHQRAWTLDHGADTVMWTYDPLVSRNAHFNLAKLGADAAAYYENFYGRMHDAINAGEESDRILAVWHLTSTRATEAAEGRGDRPDAARLVAEGATKAVRPDERQAPVVQPAAGPVALVAVPRDIVELRERDPGLAREWRLAVREALGGALANGYVADGFAAPCWYVLRRR